MNTLQIHDLRAELRKQETICPKCQKHKASDVHHINGHHHDNRPENIVPICKRCHNEIHGISDNLTDLGLVVRQFVDVQTQRVAMGNRLAAYGRLGYEATAAHHVFDGFKVLEKDIGKTVAKLLKYEPIYTLYLSNILGVGPGISGELITRIGDPGRFDTISALWSYMGLGVVNGKAPKRQRGQKAAWNHRLRMVVLGRMVPQFIKLKNNHGCFGRQLYDQYKAFYMERDGESLTKMHIENRARRKVGKVFVSCLWVAWRRIKGLSVSEPYAMKLNGHSHVITPEQWAGSDWFTDYQMDLIKDISR